MKRILFTLALLCGSAVAQIVGFNGQCSKGGQAVVTQGLRSNATTPLDGGPTAPHTGVLASYPSCRVLVYFTGTTNLVSLFSNQVGTPLTNPFTANTDGSWLFFANAGTGYDITMSGGGMPAPVTLTDVMSGGGGGGGGGSLNSVGLAMPASLFGVAGSPVTGAGGTFNVSFQSIGPHLFLGNSSALAAPASLVQPNFTDLLGVATTAQLPFLYGGTTLKLATIGNSWTPNATPCTNANLDLITVGCPQPGAGTVTEVDSGPGLSGGPITGTGTLFIPPAGVLNVMLANPFVTINPTVGGGLTGGGVVNLGGTTSLGLIACPSGQSPVSNGATYACGSTSGGVTSSTLTAGFIPMATGPSSIGNSTPPLDDGITQANALSFAGVGGMNLVGPLTIGIKPTVCGSAVNCFGMLEGVTSGIAPIAGQDACAADSTVHGFKCSLNNGTAFNSLMNLPSLASSIVGLFGGCSGTLFLGADGNCHSAGAGLTGSGTANLISKWTGATALGNSQITDDGTHAATSPNGLGLSTSGGITFDAVNDTGTGTATNLFVCKSATLGSVVTCATSTLTGVLGSAMAGVGTAPGTTGSTSVCFAGRCQVKTDNTTTVGHYGIPSTTVAGEIHDTGATTPTAGVDNFIILSVGTAGNPVTFEIDTPDYFAAQAAAKVYILQINGGSLTAGDTVNYNATTPAPGSNGYAVNFVTSKAGTTDSVSAQVALFNTNAKTATYQVLAADFSACKTIPVASGTFTITLVASGTQPPSGQCLQVINYGSGVVTIARSGQNINGGTTSITLNAGSATAPTSAYIVSDGTNYFATVHEGTVGTVTSVTFTGDGTVESSTPSSAVTTSGTVTASLANAAVGTVLGNATSSAAAPTYHTLSAINAQTATYQVTATDFAAYKTITVASGTFTITLVASGSQPAAGQYINVVNYGSGVVTIARSGQNINGGTTSLTLAAGSATAPTTSQIWSDGTNYFATVPGAGGGSPTAVVNSQFDKCVPAQTTNAGNSFFTVNAFTNADLGVWQFVLNTAADLFCYIRIPHNYSSGGTVIADFGANDATASHTVVMSIADAITSSLNLNVGSLTASSNCTVTTTATAYSNTECTWTPASTLTADQILVVKFHQAASNSVTANEQFPMPVLQMTETF